MHYISNKKATKRIAFLLLGVFIINLLQPLSAFALTSGPGQPESQSFQPVGVSDMVDLVTGDFKYNIPLMDVDGYPLNLNYQSGVGMDDEASWVGLGWNLNVGAISRQLRGIPDDFAGDEIKTDHYTKPKITVGGKLTAKVEAFGKAKIGGSFSFGVFSDNYTGLGAELGVNAGMSFSLANDGALTAGLGVGVLSNTASGVDVTPNISLSISENTKAQTTVSSGLTSSFGYNTRSGLKSLSFGASNLNFKASDLSYSFNTEPIMPKIQIPYKSSYGSFSIDVGGVGFGIFGGFGGTGYQSVREVQKESLSNPGYGFLYAEQGKDNKDAVMDFIREKENPVIPELPNLALPVHTPDIFTYNSQTGSGQFRLYRGGTGIFFDNQTEDRSTMTSLGADLGLGTYVHGGVTFFRQNTSNKTTKWRNLNNYLKKGDFQNASKTNPRRQHVFFRKVDEKNIEDAVLSDKLLDNSLLSISTSGKIANSSFVTQNDFSSNIKTVSTEIVKENPQVQNTMISYLTAAEASVAGINPKINIYPFNVYGSFQVRTDHTLQSVEEARVSDKKQKHHLSEITVNNSDGQRAVYGLPVYNLTQEEYSFALNSGYESKDGLVAIGANGIERNKGIDHYYHKETHSPYAYSYLLTALLSPDYSAKKIDSASNDDQGTAIKFHYSRIPKFKWRTPFNNKLDASAGAVVKNTAALNRGLLADPDDDKGSIIYGEKEIYYVHSIESKTKIAYFITEDRKDGLGVVDIKGMPDPLVRQKCLKEIRLYSKFNMSKPIKVVKFDYSYELCPGTPNSIAEAVPGKTLAQGKLTLKRVWFEYGLTPKGANHPYVFNYNNNINSTPVYYANMQTDRWGTYKSPVGNQGGLTNEEFPYSSQNKEKADLAAGLWHIQSIELPSGGKIEVDYEADDYAYVQNKRAMEMVPLEMINNSKSLVGAAGIRIPISMLPPSSTVNATEWFKRTYLNGSDYMYTKSYVKISTGNAPSAGKDNDFIPAYCKVNSVTIDNGKANVVFEQSNAAGVMVNPIRFAAWQRLKNEYPRYAYPGFQNRVGDRASGVEAAVSAIVNAARNLSELKENFYQKANRKGYAAAIDTDKSFAKIAKVSGFKIGGGVRVKKIAISDNWDDFTGDKVRKGTYGQSYEYTRFEDGKKISSGVATYEPSIGNDENALKQPFPYIQKIKGAINNYFELEEPFGESFYPSPVVGYSKVTVRDLEPGGAQVPKTGFIVNEFYTAKDFPVRVKVSPMQRYGPTGAKAYSLVKTQSVDEMVLSQGYSIELNDMHGKLKANRIYNQSGAEISSTEYFYKVDRGNTPEPKLNNLVKVINQAGVVEDRVIGRDIEFFTDFREQETNNSGTAINIGFDVIPAFWFPIPIPHFPANGNNEYKLFRSACAVKVIQTNGLVSKVVKNENGSSIAVENVAYDGVTGEALVTKTQNEFKKSYYSVNLPAYWVYKGMGPAYLTLGSLMQNFNTGTNGAIVNSTYSDYVMPGDELVDVNIGSHYWVIETAGAKRLIDREGKVQTVNIPMAKVIRSGYRNMLQPATSTLVCMENPIAESQFKLAGTDDLSNLKVISTSTNLFDEKWATSKNDFVIDTVVTDLPRTYYIWGRLTENLKTPIYLGYGITRTWGNITIKYYRSESAIVPPDYVEANRVSWNSTVPIQFITNGIIKVYSRVLNGYERTFISDVEVYNGESLLLEVNNGTFTDPYTVRFKSHFYYNNTYFPDGYCLGSESYTETITNNIQRPFNPYVTGYLGNWRPSQSKVYQEKRAYAEIFSSSNKNTNIKNAGYFGTFNPWWRYQNGFWVENSSVKWTTANRVTLYDKYGQELENKDALGRYSSANFDFNGQLPSAVASNAMNREIYVNSFEDTKFRKSNNAVIGEFVNGSSGSEMEALANSSLSHSGNHSLNLNSTGIFLNTNIHSQKHETGNYFSTSASGYKTLDTLGLQAAGFAPLPAQKYIISTWVKDAQPANRSINIAVGIKGESGSLIPVTLSCKAIVEGWKLLEGEINTGLIITGNKLQLTMKATGATVNIDDVRIHPKGAHMKSYVYDNKNFKLMAELDENAFATFYEYDDEGSLVRVKKETERGVMTIKESRSSYKKRGI